MSYTFTLTIRGTTSTHTVSDLTYSDGYYVSEVDVDTEDWPSVFHLTSTRSDGQEVYSHDNTALRAKIEVPDETEGTTRYYLDFRALTETEIKDNEQDARIEYLAMMLDVDLED